VIKVSDEIENKQPVDKPRQRHHPIIQPAYTDLQGAASYLGVSPDTVKQLIRDGLLRRGVPLRPGGKSHVQNFRSRRRLRQSPAPPQTEKTGTARRCAAAHGGSPCALTIRRGTPARAAFNLAGTSTALALTGTSAMAAFDLAGTTTALQLSATPLTRGIA
jgi:hypothetical protein